VRPSFAGSNVESLLFVSQRLVFSAGIVAYFRPRNARTRGRNCRFESTFLIALRTTAAWKLPLSAASIDRVYHCEPFGSKRRIAPATKGPRQVLLRSSDFRESLRMVGLGGLEPQNSPLSGLRG